MKKLLLALVMAFLIFLIFGDCVLSISAFCIVFFLFERTDSILGGKNDTIFTFRPESINTDDDYLETSDNQNEILETSDNQNENFRNFG